MGCDENISPISSDLPISIHASRMGCDIEQQPISAFREFQSTHPVWDATTCKDNGVVFDQFQSTHPVWDATSCFRGSCGRCLFQSTHPVWDATYFPFTCFSVLSIFQSTHPVWDATRLVERGTVLVGISIHASRMGCDSTAKSSARRDKYFNPRIPYGMRQRGAHHAFNQLAFQSTHPVWDATPHVERLTGLAQISIHASRMGCDPCTVCGRRS